MNRRRDIDGLRALAITLVVAYHARRWWRAAGAQGALLFREELAAALDRHRR